MRVIVSIFCNAEHYIDRYFEQIESLGVPVYLVVLEGNSTDNTYKILREKLKNYKHFFCKYNVDKVYDSIVDKQRFLNLARLWNLLLQNIPKQAEEVAFIESDLSWDAETLNFLFELTDSYNFVCPHVIDSKGLFYDIWAYRYEYNRTFESRANYAPKEIVPIYSAGSCLVMKAPIARNNRLKSHNVFVGFCENVKEELFCIPVYIYHD